MGEAVLARWDVARVERETSEAGPGRRCESGCWLGRTNILLFPTQDVVFIETRIGIAATDLLVGAERPDHYAAVILEMISISARINWIIKSIDAVGPIRL